MGRSRGGLSTKIHAVVNEQGLPLRFVLTEGQAGDAPPANILLQGLQPYQVVLADKAYDTNWIRQMIYDQGATACIPPKSNRKNHFEFDKTLYKQRNLVERFFGRLKKSFRSIATRYDKYSTNFMAMIKIASIRLWCQFYESAT